MLLKVLRHRGRHQEAFLGEVPSRSDPISYRGGQGSMQWSSFSVAVSRCNATSHFPEQWDCPGAVMKNKML